MSISQITLFAGSAQQTTVNLVALPGGLPAPGSNQPTPGSLQFKTVEFTAYDAVASSVSPFTGQTQTQTRPGADLLSVKCVLPAQKPGQAAIWKAWMLEMRGMQNAVQLSDPDAIKPQGIASARTGTPVCSTSGSNNLPMAQVLYTRGWHANLFRLLLPGDAIQIGYRFHYVLNQVNSDANGTASISIWPSLRESPPDGTIVILNQPKGLFRFAKNDRAWTRRVGQLTDFSFDLIEYR